MDWDFGEGHSSVAPATADPASSLGSRQRLSRVARSVERFTHRRWVGVQKWDEGTVKILLWIFILPLLWVMVLRGEHTWDWWMPFATVGDILGLAVLWLESTVPPAVKSGDRGENGSKPVRGPLA